MKSARSNSFTTQAALLLLTGFLTACGGGGGEGSFSFTDDEPTVLERCVEIDVGSSNPTVPQCSLEDLPFIGQLHSSPDVDEIMDRVLAEESWMEDRFRAVLQRMSQPERDLFRAVRGIVIQDQINPSFYIELTASIYLSPYHLWVTSDEFDSIETTTDPRAGNGSVFQFQEHFRYVDPDGNHGFFRAVTQNGSRSEDDSFYDTLVLLYHELAHANDFFPYSRVSGLPQNEDTPAQVLGPIINGNYSASFLSDGLASGSLALQSTELKRLAETLYFGVPADSDQTSWSPADLGTEFDADVASDLYAYSNQYEDFAMLFEEIAMQRFHQFEREVLFTDFDDDFTTCSQLVIRWGQRARVEDSEIQDRALFAASSILPDEEANFTDLVNSFTAETQITPGQDVCTRYFGARPSAGVFNTHGYSWRASSHSVRDRLVRQQH